MTTAAGAGVARSCIYTASQRKSYHGVYAGMNGSGVEDRQLAGRRVHAHVVDDVVDVRAHAQREVDRHVACRSSNTMSTRTMLRNAARGTAEPIGVCIGGWSEPTGGGIDARQRLEDLVVLVHGQRRRVHVDVAARDLIEIDRSLEQLVLAEQAVDSPFGLDVDRDVAGEAGRRAATSSPAGMIIDGSHANISFAPLSSIFDLARLAVEVLDRVLDREVVLIDRDTSGTSTPAGIVACSAMRAFVRSAVSGLTGTCSEPFTARNASMPVPIVIAFALSSEHASIVSLVPHCDVFRIVRAANRATRPDAMKSMRRHG